MNLGESVIIALFVMTVIFILFLARMNTKRTYTPLMFYVIFWGVWTVVSLNNPFLLFTVSTTTYVLVWLNITCFSIGFLLVPKNTKPIIVSELVSGFEFLMTKKFFIVQLLVFFILLYFRQKYNVLLSNLTLLDARRIVYEQGLLFESMFSNIFYYWIVTSLVYGSILLLMANYVLNGKVSVSLFIALINCVLFGSIGYGRFIYFNIIVYFLVSTGLKYDLHKKLHYSLKLKSVRRWFVYIFSLILVVYFMNKSTAKRVGIPSPTLGDTADVFINHSLHDFLIYFTGPFRALDFFVTSKITNVTGYTLGRSAIGGIEEMINNFFIFFTHSSIFSQTANETTSSFTANVISIGSDTLFNAFYTNIMNFYIDGGIPFLIVASCLYGFLSGLAYRNFLRNTNLFSFSLVVYLTYNMIASEFRWAYTTPSTWIIVIVLIVLNRKHIKRTKLI